VAHFAINADDADRGRKFYESVFGWTVRPWGPPGFFSVSYAGDERVVGAIQSRRSLVDGEKTMGFECTIAVENLEKTLAAVRAAGGQVVMEPAVIPTVGTLAFVSDGVGNVVGVMQYEA
jgi:hypothetical protein